MREPLRQRSMLGRWGTGAWLVASAAAMQTALNSFADPDAGLLAFLANYAQFALLPGTAAIIWSRRGTLPAAIGTTFAAFGAGFGPYLDDRRFEPNLRPERPRGAQRCTADARSR